MKDVYSFLIIYALIASVLANNEMDLVINQTYKGVMEQLGSGLREQNFQTAQLEHQSQQKTLGLDADSTEELFQTSNNLTFPVISQYQSIAYKIIRNAGYNTRGNYYVFDNHTKQWHRPNMTAPANPINGTIVNSQQLSTELHNAFIQLVSTGPSASEIQKRGLIDFKSFLKGLKALGPDEAAKNLKNFKKAFYRSNPVDDMQLKKYQEALKAQFRRRGMGSEQLKAIFRDVDSAPDLLQKKKILKEALKGEKISRLNEYDLLAINDELLLIKTYIKEDYGRLISMGFSPFAAKFFKASLAAGAFFFLVKFFSAINQPHYTNLDGLDLNLNQPSTENPDIGINYNLGSDSNGSTNAQTPEKAVNLEPIIRNPTTGITYYLDKSVNRYYYQDPETKQMVYYNSGSGSGGSTNGPTPEKGGNLEPIIRNPTTGITYYLDKSVNRYYYQDPQTKQMVYYNSGSGSGGSTKGPTPEKGGNLEPIIRNPTTGITYYLDKSVNRYYYQDPQTKQMVYYGS